MECLRIIILTQYLVHLRYEDKITDWLHFAKTPISIFISGKFRLSFTLFTPFVLNFEAWMIARLCSLQIITWATEIRPSKLGEDVRSFQPRDFDNPANVFKVFRNELHAQT